MRVALALVLLLSGCAADAGDAGTVELRGRITQLAAGGGDGAWVLESDSGFLPLELPDARPPMGATGVVVEVPDGVEIAGDDAEAFDALAAWTAESGEGLTVLDYLR